MAGSATDGDCAAPHDGPAFAVVGPDFAREGFYTMRVELVDGNEFERAG